MAESDDDERGVMMRGGENVFLFNYKINFSFSSIHPTSLAALVMNFLRAMFSTSRKFPEWTFEQVKAITTINPKAALIDVREVDEVRASGLIPGAVNVPLGRVPAYIKAEEDQERLLVFYCQRGMRAERAAESAKAAGHDNVAVYYGSYNDWASRNTSN